jgi:hypothetical protein
MAKVTFIIGNGFDLALGLKTSYAAFYEHIKNKKSATNNRIYKAIHESPDTWADFELRLGLYTGYIEKVPQSNHKKEAIAFHEELEELSDDLADYLAEQETDAQGLVDGMTFNFHGFYKELSSGQQEKVRSLLVREKGSEVDFISLNYTKTLEQVLSNNRAYYANRGITIARSHHLHGTLSENLTLGVSNESQISSSVSGAEKDDLIKPKSIHLMNDGRIDALHRSLLASSIVVLYGTSIGETDQYIWEIVSNWLFQNPNVSLIIHKHDSAYTDSARRLPRRQRKFTNDTQDRLLQYSGLDGNSIEELRTRVFVVHNTKELFSKKQG